MFHKTIDTEKCTACMQCAAICTNSQVIVKNEAGMPEFRYDSRCIFCGHCMAVCPQGAISFTPVPDTDDAAYYAKAMERNPQQALLPADAVFDFLCATRTNRIFLDRSVEREKLATIADAMVRAPSAGNEQNRNFRIISNPETLGRLEQGLTAYYDKQMKALRSPIARTMFSLTGAVKAGREDMGTLETTKMPFRQRYGLMQTMLQNAFPERGSAFSYLKKAPVLVLITRGKKDSQMHKAFYRGDACIAATYGILMAKALGLAACWLGLLEIALSKDAQLSQLLQLKPGERVDAAVVLGYSDIEWRRIPPRGPVSITWQP